MKRNKFNLSHYKLLTMNMGDLVPLSWMEVIPGDTFQMRTNALLRVQPLLHPVMHPCRCRIHHFFVPLEEIWEDFHDFITGGEAGTSLPTHPYISTTGAIAESTLSDYLGIPPATYTAFEYSALPFRAYALIFNRFFRDQQLVTELTIDKTSGNDTTTNQTLQAVSWGKDRFTIARPDTLLGSDVTIPLGTTAPITGIGSQGNATWSGASGSVDETDGTGAETYANYINSGQSSPEYIYIEEDPSNAGFPNIRADLSAATGVDIEDLRLAIATQKYRERMNAFGARYVEYLRYLGIKGDGRIEPVDYLAGGSQTISFSEVLSTDGSNTGDMKGHGIAALRSRRFRRFFREHGILMTVMSVVPKTIYAQGLHKGFKREVKEDYFQYEFQHIGDQAILNSEIYTEHSSPDGTFGYIGRYDSYRNHPSNIAGEFHSTRDDWHMARIFSSDPALNSTFINCTPTTRIYASAATDQLMVMAGHSVQARRMMAKYAVPKLIG